MSDQPLDLGAIKARHQPAGPRYCNSCGGTSWPCETYQLAVRAEESDHLTAALVHQFKRAEAAEAKLARVAAVLGEDRLIASYVSGIASGRRQGALLVIARVNAALADGAE